MNDLLQLIPKLRGKRIGVFGDLIADEYVYGTIHRFSREAPVFIVNYEESQIGPGGAANAVNNIHELGGVPIPFGFLGDDYAGRTLHAVLKEKGIRTDGILTDASLSTFVKQRVVAGSPHSVKQQILRIDRCFPLAGNAEYHTRLIERAKSMFNELDALIVSDYGLGVAQSNLLSPILQELKNRGVPCLVDSRQNLRAYRGIAAATPNEPEVEAMIGQFIDSSNLVSCGTELLQTLQADSILITRGKNGMALFTKNDDPKMIPIFGTTEIVDVTGAGDTVISTFALALTAGASYYNAARLANCAAGIVVMKRGAATVTAHELSEAIRVASMQK